MTEENNVEAVVTAGFEDRRVSAFSGMLFAAYRVRVLRPVVRDLLDRLEGGVMFSETLRRIYLRYERVTLGRLSYGPGLKPGVFPAGTAIGSFCSFAGGIRVLRRNHPTNWASQHPLFFNRVVGLVQADRIHAIRDNPLTVGHDAWVGLNAIICPGCRSIGDGAIVGAGAVVTRDVPAYTIVAGSPARVVRKRFSPEAEAVVAASEWWLRPVTELVKHVDLFSQELAGEAVGRFAEAFPPRPRPSGSGS